MVETTAQIETHIEKTREYLGENLDALEQKIRSATDWREYFHRRPMTFLGAAFAGGVLLAMTTVTRPHGRGERAVRSPDSAPRPRGVHAGQVATMIENIKGTLIGMAAMKMKDLVNQAVPGFKDEFDRRLGAGASVGPASAQAQTR